MGNITLKGLTSSLAEYRIGIVLIIEFFIYTLGVSEGKRAGVVTRGERQVESTLKLMRLRAVCVCRIGQQVQVGLGIGGSMK